MKDIPAESIVYMYDSLRICTSNSGQENQQCDGKEFRAELFKPKTNRDWDLQK